MTFPGESPPIPVAKPGGDAGSLKEKSAKEKEGPPRAERTVSQMDVGFAGPMSNDGNPPPLPPAAVPVAPSPSEGANPPVKDAVGRDSGPGDIESVKGNARRPVQSASDAPAGAKGAEPSRAIGSTEPVIAPPSPSVQREQAAPVSAGLDLTASNASRAAPPSARAEPAAPPVTAAPAPHAPSHSPAGQVAPVMVSLAGGPAGTHRLVLRLDPPDLGRVEICMVRAPETGARVEITAERPATLALLRLDEPALHRALNDAGVPQDGRTLTMQLGQPGGQDLTRQGNGQGSGHGGESARRYAASGFESDSASPLDMQPVPTPRFSRAALDITA